ncbi:hypothetical protein FF100_11955 [Methylobacterium terricola]|uniref:Uncharacterized protein n=1 Tax=Methylobacterium terricola TaxID=2583531 RepID=A0A5C4LHC5_9HYPH|nr:hypothetical protein [Methylobacterium terricola]TNC13497.1 hypothetical protein FF100_11955 [Methylobacterium terricola]
MTAAPAPPHSLAPRREPIDPRREPIDPRREPIGFDESPGGHAGRAVAAAVSSRLGHLPFAVVLALTAAPNLIFLATHLASAPLAAGAVALLAAALAGVWRDLARTTGAPLDRPLLAAALAVGFGLCLLGGQAHLFFANDDWLIRDAVLHDLVAAPWPVGYLYAGDPTMLRAPLGLYLLPALIGKAAGLYGAHLALLAQNGLLFGCLFYGVARAAPSRRQGLGRIAVFVAFSGWDVVGSLLAGDRLIPGIHLEQWAGDLQFSSHVTQLFWVPNHAASGWIFVSAYWLWRAGALRATSLAVVFGLCVFWSPLSMMGALPFLLAAFLADAAGGRLEGGSVAVVGLALLGLAPVALYLGADAGRVPHGLQAMTGDFPLRYAFLLLLDIVPALVVLALAPGRGDRWAGWEIGLVLLLLVLAPLYRLGGADFVMRASIPALAVLALRVGAVVPGLEARRLAVAVLVLGLGAVTPLYEVIRAVLVPPFAISPCSLLAASRTPPNNGTLYHYVARIDALEGHPAGAIFARPETMIRRVPQGMCWPDHPAHQEGAGSVF